MGGKNSAKRKSKKSGDPRKQEQGRTSGGARNDFRGVEFRESQVLGHGTMAVNTYVQQYAPVPTALDALPQLPAWFTGRDDDIVFILGVLDPDRPGVGPAVAVLSGWGGVGKTTLAYAAGHAAKKKSWFTGVLLVDLRGYDAHPAQAADALEALLLSLGLRPENLPPPGAGQEALYRSQLNARQEAGERLLVVADNASTVAQVQPLLPPGHHGMLVTSRHSLTGLGRLRTVNRLQPEDAVALLEAALKNNDPDDTRVEQAPEAAEQVALACGYLPLALQITAALLAQDPGQPLSERAAALGQAEGVLDGLNDGERSLRTTFDQSFERLSPPEQDLFRLLSLNPGPDVSSAAASVLADQPQLATDRLLGRLAASHLIERNPAIRGRWQMHDLLRAYAREQAQATVARGRAPRRRYEQAHGRLIDYYVEHAWAGDSHIHSRDEPVSPQFADREEALAWFDAERENLIATARTTSKAGLRLGFALGDYLEWRRRHQDLLLVRSIALDACHALKDTRNEASAWNNVGNALQDLRRSQEAIHAHTTARSLHQQNGDASGEAIALSSFGNALKDLNRLDEALDAHQTALKILQRIGDARKEADVWNNLGLVLRDLGRFDEALHAHQADLEQCQQTSDLRGEAIAWNNLGLVFRELGRFDEALHAHRTALEYFEQAGDTYHEGAIWNNLGTAYRALERFDEAATSGRRSVEKLTESGDWFRTGEAWGELATTLATASADRSRVRDAWNESAVAYTRAGAPRGADASRMHANDAESPKAMTGRPGPHAEAPD